MKDASVFLFSEDKQALRTRSQFFYQRIYQLAGKVSWFLRRVRKSENEFGRVLLLCVCAHIRCRGLRRSEASGPPGAGLTGGCELSDLRSRNQT